MYEDFELENSSPEKEQEFLKLQIALRLLVVQANALKSEINNERNQRINVILNQNIEIVPEAIYEEYEQTMTDIRMKSLLPDFQEYSEEQFAKMETIASGCPNIHGRSVHSARTILKRLNPEREFEKDCSEVHDRSSQPASFKANLQIAPNPAQGFTTIYFPNDNQKRTVELFDVSGKIIQKWSSDFQYQFLIDLDQVKKGFYFISVIENDKVISTEKLILN